MKSWAVSTFIIFSFLGLQTSKELLHHIFRVLRIWDYFMTETKNQSAITAISRIGEILCLALLSHMALVVWKQIASTIMVPPNNRHHNYPCMGPAYCMQYGGCCCHTDRTKLTLFVQACWRAGLVILDWGRPQLMAETRSQVMKYKLIFLLLYVSPWTTPYR